VRLTNHEIEVLLIGGVVGAAVILGVSVAFLVRELRRAPLVGDCQQARAIYEEGRAAMNAAADDLGIGDAHLLTFDTARVDEIDGWVATWAEQQRKEGR
jgi:hypothetical protein